MKEVWSMDFYIYNSLANDSKFDSDWDKLNFVSCPFKSNYNGLTDWNLIDIMEDVPNYCRYYLEQTLKGNENERN